MKNDEMQEYKQGIHINRNGGYHHPLIPAGGFTQKVKPLRGFGWLGEAFFY
jgi:hypothetical protein